MQLSEETTSDLVRRLARIEGQVRGLQAMIRDGRECREIVAQLSRTNARTRERGRSARTTNTFGFPELPSTVFTVPPAGASVSRPT